MAATDLNVDIVGREFVRQYYTVLNQRPDCLHLFFTQDSSLVHGGIEKPGEEEPAYKGQTAIRQKILSLGFLDCHTKICQVDCQQTISSAVLVQVSGELSNGGEPMRRFMQSFVLVQQAPKKFYVHNDIFRYQDEVFCDAASENGGSVAGTNTLANGEDRLAPKELANHADTVSKVEATNGEHLEVEDKIEPTTGVRSARASECEADNTMHVETNFEKLNFKPIVSKAVVVETRVVEAPPTEEPAEPAHQSQTSRPFSWASMASKNAGVAPNNSMSPAGLGVSKPQATIRPEMKSDAVNGVAHGNSVEALPPRNARNRPTQDHISNDNDRKWAGGHSDATQMDGEMGSGEPNEETMGKMGGGVPDDQQLFVGNLPHFLTEEELIEIFEKYGKVLDVKINHKGINRDLPNFGFVIFDSHEAVVKALRDKPITLPNKRRINIEQKKSLSELTPKGRMGIVRNRGLNRPSFNNRRVNNNNDQNRNDAEK